MLYLSKYIQFCRSRALISLSVEGAHVMFCTLFYDYRFVVNIEETCLHDYNGITVLHLYKPQLPTDRRYFCPTGLFTPSKGLFTPVDYSSADPSLDSMSTPRSNSTIPVTAEEVKASAQKLSSEESINLSYSSLVITLVVQDRTCPWGQGGLPVESIYSKDDGQRICYREGNFMFKVERLVSLLSPEYLQPTLDAALRVANLLKRSFSQHRNAEKGTFNIDFDFSIQSYSKELDYFLKNEKQWLSHICIRGAELLLNDLIRSSQSLPVTLLTLHSVTALDLIPAHKFHELVLALDGQTEYMIKLQCLADEDEKFHVKVCVALHGVIEIYNATHHFTRCILKPRANSIGVIFAWKSNIWRLLFHISELFKVLFKLHCNFCLAWDPRVISTLCLM